MERACQVKFWAETLSLSVLYNYKQGDIDLHVGFKYNIHHTLCFNTVNLV